MLEHDKKDIKTLAIEAFGQRQMKAVKRSNNEECYRSEIKELANL